MRSVSALSGAIALGNFDSLSSFYDRGLVDPFRFITSAMQKRANQAKRQLVIAIMACDPLGRFDCREHVMSDSVNNFPPACSFLKQSSLVSLQTGFACRSLERFSVKTESKFCVAEIASGQVLILRSIYDQALRNHSREIRTFPRCVLLPGSYPSLRSSAHDY